MCYMLAVSDSISQKVRFPLYRNFYFMTCTYGCTCRDFPLRYPYLIELRSEQGVAKLNSLGDFYCRILTHFLYVPMIQVFCSVTPSLSVNGSLRSEFKSCFSLQAFNVHEECVQPSMQIRFRTDM